MKQILFGTVLLFISNVWALSAAGPSYDRVLFVGDSHSAGRFGVEVDKYLRTISSDVTSMASCGSSPSTWMYNGSNFKKTNCGYWSRDNKGNEKRVTEHRMSSFPEDLKKIDPNLTVIALGTNILASPGNIASEKKSIEDMLKLVSKNRSKCIWVGPPNIRKEPFANNLKQGVKEIKSLVQKYNCDYIDSTKMTEYPAKGDGIHYGSQDSAKWGVAVTKEMEQIRVKQLATEKLQEVSSPVPSEGTKSVR